MNGHHIWCNGHPNSPVDTCRWCSGPKGLHARYPEDCPPEELVKKHFSSAIPRCTKNLCQEKKKGGKEKMKYRLKTLSGWWKGRNKFGMPMSGPGLRRRTRI